MNNTTDKTKIILLDIFHNGDFVNLCLNNKDIYYNNKVYIASLFDIIVIDKNECVEIGNNEK